MVVRVTTAKSEPADSAQPSIATGSFAATLGNLIVVIVRCGATGLVSSVTDTAGNTYVEAISSTGQDPKIFIYYAENITGHASNVVTVNFSPSAVFSWAYAVQYSGLDPSSPLDAVDVKTGTGVTDLVSDPFTTSSPGVIVLGASQANFTTYTAGADFTLIDGQIGNNTGDNFGGVEERITSGALSSYTAHITSGVTNSYTLGLAAFNAALETVGPEMFRGRSFPFFDDEEVNRFEFWPAVAGFTTHERAASIDAIAALSSSAEFFSVLERSATVDATAAITVSGARVVERSAALSATGDITSAGESFTLLERSSSVSATASIETSAQFFTVFESASAISATATITVTGQRVSERSASISATAGIETSAEFFTAFERSVACNAVGSIESAGIRIVERSVAVDATGLIQVAGQAEFLRSASLSSTADISTSGQVIPPGVVEHERGASLSATGAVEVNATFFSVFDGAVSVSGTAEVSVSGLTIRERSASLSGSASISVSGQFFSEISRAVSLGCTASISVSGSVPAAIEHERSVAIGCTATISVHVGVLVAHVSRTVVVGLASRTYQVGVSSNVLLVPEAHRSISVDAEP